MRAARFAAIWIVLGVLAVGCLGPGTTRSPRLYVLRPTAPQTAGGAGGIAVGVGPVRLPKRYDRPQIVTRTGDNELAIDEFSQWAEPLENNVDRVLAENLSRRVPTDRVSVYPWPHGTAIDVRVEVDVSLFEGREGGGVELEARWRLLSAGGEELTVLRHSRYTVTPASSQMDARVGAMSAALGELSSDIAAALTTRER